VNRLTQINEAQATAKQEKVLEDVASKYGRIPTMMAMMANSPAVLKGYMDFNVSLVGTLSRKLHEQIAVAVSEYNQCAYCLAAHVVGAQKAGLTDDEILAARRFRSDDPKAQAALQFAHQIVTQRGHVSDEALEQLRAAGFGDDEIVEIIGSVSINIFRNYFNIVADSEPEQPRVRFLSETLV
jgi:uncharacterized peroxidase-related enzyme